MEFLTTYGWVLLVVLIAVAALAYFGILKPGDQLPENCLFFPGIGCNDFKVTQDSVTLLITNGMGVKLTNVSFTVLGEGPCKGDTSQTENIDNGVSKTFVITCTEKPTPDSAFRRQISISYTELDGLAHTRIGDISAKVEKDTV